MPKLMILAVCERVIYDQQVVPSLISIFQRMNVQIQDAPLPDNALAPNRWAVFTLWQHEPSELGVDFVQLTEVIIPSGVKFVETRTPFKITEDHDLQSKNTVEVFGIPISHEGFITVRVWLGGKDEDVAEYRFFVKHQRKDSPL